MIRVSIAVEDDQGVVRRVAVNDLVTVGDVTDEVLLKAGRATPLAYYTVQAVNRLADELGGMLDAAPSRQMTGPPAQAPDRPSRVRGLVAD